MKVTLKIDSELLPIIVKALRDYTDRSIVDMVESPAVAKPKPVAIKPAKRRGRPPGRKNASKVAVAVSAPAAIAA
jgi:hypothetical protein